ncbi:DNA-binding protein [Actinoplanes regularis]|uniref:DNA-binding protein n=1 Tax=Actinoplanes regularis TaxID=52697 RepID=UPI0025523386|nr:DNA-binding protein [Actinoplanes regularis]
MRDKRPELMGTFEIGIRLGSISRQRVNQLTIKTHFPKPAATLAQGRVWLAEDVEEWITVHRTEPARGIGKATSKA